MSYELSFSPEFTFAEAEPYDRSGVAVNKEGNPVSIWSALAMMPDESWNSMCEDVFPGIEPEYITRESVMEKIEGVNTCSNLTVPVSVWIDEDGHHTVEVYEADSVNDRNYR